MRNQLFMEREPLPPSPAEAATLSLADLFAPRTGKAAQAVAQASSLDIPQALAARWTVEAQQGGYLPDTLFAAAWLLLQSRWLGTPAVELHEVLGTGAAARLALRCEPDSSAWQWISQVDRARRDAQPAEASASPFARWLREGAAHVADGTVMLQLGLQTPPGRPAALRLTGAASLMDSAIEISLLLAVADAAADLLDHPEARLGEIRTLPAADRKRQLEAWNTPPGAFDPALTVHALFERQAAARGDAVALIGETGALSYRELDQHAESLARQLQARGVRAGHTVGVLLDRSSAAVVALLGILKAGAAYVPVQPDFPAERIAFMLAHSDVGLVVTQAAYKPLVPAERPLLAIDEQGAGAGDETAALPPFASAAANGESVAYVMYTSGSTGTPKGIEICHRSILRLVVEPNYVELPPGEAVLHAAPLGFDASTLEIWGPLLNGGICVVHDEKVPSGAGLARTIARHQVKTAWLTAGLFNAVVDDDPAQLAGLRQLLTGGEALSVPHVRRALAALPGTTLVNGYGPTECTTFAATHRIPRELPADARSVPIGRPINETALRVLSPSLALLPAGLVGELCIGGRGLARGYLESAALTAERFVADPFADGERLYRTGDQARWLPDGTIEYIGRIDGQVKIRGHRIETGEIEAALLAHPGLKSCAVVPQKDAAGRLRLVAYLVARDTELPWSALRQHLAERLPEPMIPAAQVWLAQLPVTTNGKLDRRALPEPARQRPELAQPYAEARNETERRVCAAFARALGIDQVGRDDNFFDLGGDSLLVLRVLKDLQQGSARRLSTNLFFRQPTPAALAADMQAAETTPAVATPAERAPARPAAGADSEAVALVAMAGRFPGAADVEQFWDNLMAGRESISFFDDATLDAGVSAALRADPLYVRARGVLDGIENFDAAFFGINPKEAELMDPQQRVFLEICWECLERGGYVPDQAPGPVGVYAGMYNASYFQRHVSTRPDLVEMVGEFQVMLGNEKDYITTRVANRLNLTGPAVSVHTACSTSLVAVAQAFHALRTGQCRMALAGGASVTCPPRSGYLYNEGSMLSPDGHTRSFDAKAKGTVFSDGATVVLLKRLSDAIADGDTIYAVLRGAAVNNDGGAKASFTAPSVDGQAAVIEAALAQSGVEARSISYVETHGTATPMGDPIEVEGLVRAYASHTADKGFCTIGSLKSNVGHMVTAAGAAGLIKTALALHCEAIPASLHYEAPNPAIDFDATPFSVNSQLRPWPRGAVPRRAGVSAFGVGGTNAHVIVEEAPLREPSDAATGPQLLVLSARSQAALATAAAQLADHLDAHRELPLADVAHTLRVGRKAFAHRACVVASSIDEAVAALRTADSPARAGAAAPAWVPQPVFMFPGQGAQYAGMGLALHAAEPVFRAAFDECLQAFEGVLDFDLRERIASDDPAALSPTSVTQPATFALEYALARQLMSLGVQPAAMIGHSVGEFAAAVLAGVMRLEDAARLVARRGALMQAQPAGIMLSVRLAAAELLPLLPEGISLAADNGPAVSVAAGPAEAIEQLRAALEAKGIVAKALQTSHAFHSAMMEPAVAPFEALVRELSLSAPRLPIYSTLTGRLLTAEEATDPHYWARHLRETVRFSPAVREVLAQLAHPLFVELGPRNTLATLVRQHASKAQPAPAVSLLADQPAGECAAWRLAAGRLWAQGAEIDLSPLDRRARKHRVRLPTTPFERKRFWVDIASSAPVAPALASSSIPQPAPQAPSIPELTSMTAAAAISPPPARRASLVTRLRELFENLSGADMAEVDGAAPFVEIGLDSLTLTQAALQVKKTFKVNLSFRQLMESYRSFDALAEFLDATLPPEAAPAMPPAAPMPAAVAPQQAVATVAAMPAMAMPAVQVLQPLPAVAQGGSLVQQVIAQQMQLMQQQLALLSAAPTVPVSPVLPVPPVEQPTPMATAAATASNTPEPAAEEPAPAPTYDVKKAFGAIARIHTQSKEPTERQKARLAAFMRRYVERTQKSKAFTEQNRPHMADPRVVNGFRPATKEITYQIVIERSKGSRMWDIDGNEYVDTLNGFGMNLFGWTPDFINEAVKKQLELGYEIGPQHPLAADVTRLLCELTGFDRAGLCNTGSEAVMAALRIARTVTGRSTVVLFTGSYHGTFDEVLVRAGRSAKGMSAAPGVLQGMFGDVRVLDYGTPEALEFIRANADDLAAVLVEPVQSRRPDFQPREFLREVRAITEKSESCLIFDEVITGFRCDLGGAQALFGIRADLATYGKVLGGGMPVGVIAGKRTYMDALDGGPWQYGDDSVPTVGVTYFAGTFVRHPLALAASKAALEYLKQDNNKLQTQLNLHTAAMADELTAFCREVGAPLEIRYFSSLWRVSWLEDHPLQDLLFAMMRSRGVHILDNFPCFMTTAHSQQDIATIKSAFKESIAEMQEAELLPRRAAPRMALDPAHPPTPNARLGRDKDGQPAWFVPDPKAQGKFTKYQA
ncbi:MULTISPECIES: polyketide synthase [unclassified Variovorax]|uniref:polyketide synthase n=3 Tax=Variovorax TaxID=34072 RepID=UPI000CC29A85|nr:MULTISPECIES: polyketide synthase [unclassified Variovorax]PNG59826.1 Polyketide synthase PksJ [Variovorax sp. B4]PNG60383.1 Polyketide synthase PksJ [Variovorax sp. B2]VTV13756.1 Polyketide synthase PksJ [Variovorax sp. WDL1]